MTYTAENWPIACAMLALGSQDSHGDPIHDASTEEWAKHLRQGPAAGQTSGQARRPQTSAPARMLLMYSRFRAHIPSPSLP
jgi:hypothetical protein